MTVPPLQKKKQHLSYELLQDNSLVEHKYIKYHAKYVGMSVCNQMRAPSLTFYFFSLSPLQLPA